MVKPGVFSEKKRSIFSIPPYHSLLKPLITAICGSDIQYYRGEKSSEKLKLRLPLILLHEGVCLDLITGKRVVPVAGDFRNVPSNFIGKENLWPELPYMGASMPGLARTSFIYSQELLLPVPDEIPNETASLVEPTSIAIKSLKEMNINANDKVAIIGTGGMAFLMMLILAKFANIPKANLYIFGINNDKLKYFQNFAQIINYEESDLLGLRSHFTAVLEAVGRTHINTTLNLAFKLIRPGGKIGILGISHLSLALPSNQLVNQRIEVKGLTRSTYADYISAIEFIKTNSISTIIKNDIIYPGKFLITSTKDLRQAFEFADSKKSHGRILLEWPTII
ncbi:hypothetical protein HY214_01430 [Candidatus Roizmanbacteria bacterium]|nr:hypothetical protein [Candidatus Roizmanbacteria bacterium]